MSNFYSWFLGNIPFIFASCVCCFIAVLAIHIPFIVVFHNSISITFDSFIHFLACEAFVSGTILAKYLSK